MSHSQLKGAVSVPSESPCQAVFVKYQVSAFPLHLAGCQVRKSPAVISHSIYFQRFTFVVLNSDLIFLLECPPPPSSFQDST